MDVPSPIDLRTMSDALAWAASAMEKRPWRADFFARFRDAIAARPGGAGRILELGSGPGFLAERLVPAFPAAQYVALDFSPAMHELARRRLAPWVPRVTFVERNFRDAHWSSGLGEFDCVVTHQAVHELRHKRYAAGLHAQVRALLAEGGCYLVCDHFAGDGGMADGNLYMSVQEQRAALHTAGFESVDLLLEMGGLALHQATPR